MQQAFVEITATLQQDRPRSLAVWTGELDEHGDQIWIFLRETLPYWLAERKSLLPSITRRLDRLEARLARIEQHLGLDRTRH